MHEHCAKIICLRVNCKILQPGQNKNGQKKFQLHRFLNTFLQLAAEKKYSKNGAAGNFFGPSYFVTALVLNHFKNDLESYLFHGFNTGPEIESPRSS